MLKVTKKKVTKKVSRDSRVRGWVPVCRELPFLTLLSVPPLEGLAPHLGLAMGEVDSLAQLWGGLLPGTRDEAQTCHLLSLHFVPTLSTVISPHYLI